MNSELSQNKEKADNLFNEKNYKEAIDLYSSLLDKKESLDEEEIGALYQLLGRCYYFISDFTGAKTNFLESYNIRKSVLGEDNSTTLITAEWLGATYSYLEEWQEAKELFQDLLRIRRKILDKDDKAIFKTIIGLVKINGAFDIFNEQKDLLIEAVESGDGIFGENANETMDAKFRLIELYYDNSAYEDAVGLLKRMHADYSEEYEDDETILKILKLLGDNYDYIEGKQKETEYYYKEAIRIFKDIDEAIDYNYLRIHYKLGRSLLYDSKNYVEAEKAFKVVIENNDEILTKDSWIIINAYKELGEAFYDGHKELVKAEENLNKALDIIKSSRKDHPKKIVRINYYLAQILIDKNEREDAERLLKKTIELSKTVYGLNHNATATLSRFQFKHFPTSAYTRKLALESKMDNSLVNDYNDYVKEAFKSETNNKKIRVFISSTFRDMMQEREYLMKNVFPKLRKLCRKRGYDFTEVDLRWGITEEDADKGRVIEICLNEIDKSRPFFVGMIGERYGWIPEIEDSRDFKKMLMNFEWLNKDIQEELSVTEMEIQYGVLRNPSMIGNAFFYLRDQSITPDNEYFIEKQDSREYKKLTQLKKNLKNQHDFPVKDYTSIEELGDSIFADLKRAIFGEEKTEEKVSEINAARDKQLNFVKSLCDFYIPDKKLLKIVDKFIRKGSLGIFKKSNMLVIHGDKGGGRSALLANYIKSYYTEKDNLQKPIFFHFVEADQDNKNSGEIVKRIIQEINQFSNTGIDFQDVNHQNPAPILEEVFRKAGKDMIIIIDGLEKIKTNEFFSSLYWIPENVPSNVRIILTTNNEEIYCELGSYDGILSNFLTNEQAEIFVEKYLEKFGKKLTKKQSASIVLDEIAQNPSSLKLVLDELRIFGVFEELDDFIENYLEAKNDKELFTKLLERLENDYEVENEGLIGRLLSFIVLSKNGILESEVINFAKTAPVYWSPIYNSIENYLYRNLGQLSVINEDFSKAIRERYLKDAKTIKSIHSKMASYFLKLDDKERTYDEVSYHLFELIDFKRLKDHLSDIDTFLMYYKSNPQEFTNYWNELKMHYDFAETYKKSFEYYEKKSDTIPTDLVFAAERISTMFGMEGKTEDSSYFSEKSLDIAEKIYGDKHLETAKIISKYMSTLYNNKEYAKAEKYAFKAIEIFESNSDKSSKYASLLSTLTHVYIAQDKLDLAEEYLEKCKSLLVNMWGEDSFVIAAGPYIQYAQINIKKKDFEQALYYCNKSISIFKRFGGKDHMIMFTAMDTIVEIYLEMEQLNEALQAIDKSLENKLQALGDGHLGVLTSILMKSTILVSQGLYEEAEKLLSENFEKCKTQYGLEYKLTQASLKLLVNCYRQLGNTKMEDRYKEMIL